MAVSSDSSFSCKLTWISVENSLTQAISWIASLHLVFRGLFCNLSCPFHYFLPHFVLVSLSLLKTKGQITIVYMEELWGYHCHYPKFQFDSHQTSEYGRAYNLHKISSFITLLHKAMIYTSGTDETKWRGYLNLWLLCCCHLVLRMWGQEGSVYL
jgi:hypothetical protein